MIIWNSRTEMVNVVKPDVAGEPLEHFGQFVERTALQRCLGVIPVAAAFPVNAIKLMLHIKQPYPSRAGYHQHRQLNDQERLKPKYPDQSHSHQADRQIR